MLGRRNKAVENALARSRAIDEAQAVIEFNPDGTIIPANENFLSLTGYSLKEIIGRHYDLLVPESERQLASCREIWTRLGRGEPQALQHQCITKEGRPIWIQAFYVPIRDRRGKPCKVVKFAIDITEHHLQSIESAGKLAAIDRAQAVIEFSLDGKIITANENFLKAVGYSLEEIVGKHHRMFVAPELAASADYREFWSRLNRGELVTGEFKRLRKDGKEIWILASYNPILDEAGKVLKVVKFASDVTDAKLKAADSAGQIDAIRKSQAVIEFAMDGTIRSANPNFLDAMGYRSEEVVGRHHSMFVEPKERSSPAYAAF